MAMNEEFVPVEEVSEEEFVPVAEVEQKQRPKSIAEFALVNAPTSFVNQFKGFVQPETYQGLGQLAQTINPGTWGLNFLTTGQNPFSTMFNMGQMEGERLKKTWGSPLESAYQDPFQMLSDVSAFGSLAGKGMEMANMFPRLAKGIMKFGQGTEPLNAVTGVAKVPMKFIPRQVVQEKAERLYSSALKGLSRAKLEEKQQILKTGLKEGIPVSRGGLVKLSDAIDLANDEFAYAIDDAMQTGVTIRTKDVANRIDDLEDWYMDAPNPEEFIPQLEELKTQFMAKHGINGVMDADEAQRIKMRIYQLNKEHYGTLGSVKVEGNKALARGIREEFIKRYPELKELGYRERDMINLQAAIEKAIGRIENKDIIGIGTPIKTGVGHMLGGKVVGAIVGFATAIFGNPQVKSRLAIALTHAKEARHLNPTYTAGRQVMQQAGQLDMNKLQETSGW